MIRKYQYIADELRRQLYAEGFGNENRLPTEEALRARYNVSRQTVRQALATLESEGLIRRRQGSGSFATGLHPDASFNRIAILLPSEDDYTFARLRSDLQLPLTKAGFSVSFYLNGYSIARERFILESLAAQPPRGLIADTVKNLLPNPNLDLYEKLWSAGCATVFLHGTYENFPSRPSFVDDDIGGGHLIAQHLIAQRHTRIAGIFRAGMRSGAERYFGAARACADARLPFSDEHILWYTDAALLRLQKEQDTAFLADFIRQSLGSCSAVICHDDEIAYWLVRELTRAGYHVPEDVSVAGFDNSYLCEFSQPTLTSLARRPSDFAATAASALFDMLRGTAPAPSDFHWELIPRESTAPPA